MNRKIFIKSTLLLMLFATVCCVASIASACPTCKDGVAANDPEHVGMVKGYFYSILFMMGTPYVVMTCFGLYMWRQVKLARAKKAAEDAASGSAIASGINAEPTAPMNRRVAERSNQLVEV
jgi:uncharacterized membrane protein